MAIANRFVGPLWPIEPHVLIIPLGDPYFPDLNSAGMTPVAPQGLKGPQKPKQVGV